MNSVGDASQRSWLIRNRVTLIAAVAMLAYAAFVQWAWGWPVVLAQFLDVGIVPLVAALTLLASTYFLRCWRIYDYFPTELRGRFRPLFRVTQIHNILNIMLPFRAGETSFPLLMRTEFGMPLAKATSALLVMRLLDLHALFAAAGVGLLLRAENRVLAVGLWLLFLVAPVLLFSVKRPVFQLLETRLPERFSALVVQIHAGLPAGIVAFLRAWGMTVLNWSVKVVVLAWALALMGVLPLAACFGGALGGELSSVLPLHAPGGVGTYPAGITAGALAFGASSSAAPLATLARASVSAHLLIILSALLGTGVSMLIAPPPAHKP